MLRPTWTRAPGARFPGRPATAPCPAIAEFLLARESEQAAAVRLRPLPVLSAFRRFASPRASTRRQSQCSSAFSQPLPISMCKLVIFVCTRQEYTIFFYVPLGAAAVTRRLSLSLRPAQGRRSERNGEENSVLLTGTHKYDKFTHRNGKG